jgi:hypothetical protein
MRKNMRKAVKFEARVQALNVLSMTAKTSEERRDIRRKLADGLSSRVQPGFVGKLRF